MPGLADVVALLAPMHLSIGAVERLCRVSVTCRLVLADDPTLWAAYSRVLGLRRARPRAAVIAMLHTQARCRECGSRSVPRQGVRVCAVCASDPIGYCAMVDARFVKRQLNSSGCGRLFAAVTARVCVVRRTSPNSMRVFWRHQALYHIHRAVAIHRAVLVD